MTMTQTRDAGEISAEVAPELELVANPDSSKSDAKGSDPYLVQFEQPHDAENPLDWSTGRKWMVTDVLSATSFNRIMVSTIMAPALSAIAVELDMSPTESAMSLSAYLLASVFGPLFIGPLSEIYGRTVILHTSNVWFLVWNIVCGFATTKGTLTAARFMAGFGASAIYALAGGVLGDMWRPEQRGRSMSIYLLIPLLGAAVGPIIGGFITQRTTWRWIFWATSIFQGVMIIVSFTSFHESYGPLLLRRRAVRFRKQTGEQRYQCASERENGNRSATVILMKAMSRPCRLLLFHPIIQIASVLSGFGYGLLYITLSTLSNLWIFQYGESVEISGLHYISFALGEIAGSQLGGYIMDRRFRRKDRPTTSEERLPMILPSLAIAWGGLLMYGWTAAYRVHWVVVDIGVFLMMFGSQIASMPMMAYVIDSYGDHTSSALAAQQFMRSLTAFDFPLFAPNLYTAIGYGWGNSVLALFGVVVVMPLPVVLYKYGSRLRAKASSTY